MPVDKDTIRNHFLEVLGEPTSRETLNEYIQLVLCRQSSEIDYTENHHIFPQAVFPEKSGDLEYQVHLTYKNHVHAHLLLAEAYPIKPFIYPLRMMIKDNTKTSKLLSEATKKWWKEFKQTPDYDTWRKKRSEYTTQSMKNGLASKLSNRRFLRLEERKKVGDHFRKMWEDSEYRQQTIRRMKEVQGSDEMREMKSIMGKKRWSDDAQRKQQKERMAEVNSREEKRNSAGKKIKELWKTPEFKEKMKNRKSGFWWNNGTFQVKSVECPVGFVRGMLKHRWSKK